MKKIVAIIRPHTLDGVKDALLEKGIKGMTVSEVRGIGRQKGQTEVYRGAEYQIDFIPKIKIEIVVPDDKLETAASAIISAAKTGQIGDGKLFVSTIDDVIRVRTEESGENALN
jgi:nitrogen regulatory protein PII